MSIWCKAAFRSREFWLICLILALVAGVSWVDVGFARWDNLRDVLMRAAPTAIVACGVMLVVVMGEIDISVGSLMAVLAATLGVLTSSQEWGLPSWVGVVAVLSLGTLIGTITGSLVAWGGVPSILATLGLLTGLRGLTMVIMQGENIDGLPAGLMQGAKYGVWGVPYGIWVAGLVILGTWLVIEWTPWGRRCYALGSSPHAAQMLGLAPHWLVISVFAYTGFLTGLATLIEVPRLPKIEAGIGQGFELTVVTGVVVGGVSVAGGRGRLLGVMLAVILMALIRPALTFLDIGEAGERWTKAIQGVMILLAVVSDTLLRKRSGGER